MIKYSLRCAEGHAFDSWFASADAFDTLQRAGQVTCAICGSVEVEKALMAPNVTPSRRKRSAAPLSETAAQSRPGGEDTPTAHALTQPGSDAEAALAEFRAKVEANTEDVGRRFAEEARAMHEGRTPERAIRGEANLGEARSLVEDGVPVMPLPFRPTRQVN